MTLNVLLVGEESAGSQTLKLLLGSPHTLVGVLASPAPSATGFMTAWNLAEKQGCRRWPAERIRDPAFAEIVRAEQVDLLVNVHSLFVIPAAIVAAPRIGSFNLHPGPLPRYAGLNAPSWAIYRGERRHGVTVHRMLAGIDTGPIAYQTPLDITDTDTGFTLSAKCARAGIDLIGRLLDAAARDPASIPEIPQDPTQREYFGRRTPHDGWLVWSRSAREVYDFVRAADYSPFPSPWRTPRSRLGDTEVGFVKVTPTGRSADAAAGTIRRSDSGVALVAAADEWVAVDRLVVQGKPVSAARVLEPGRRLTWDE